MSRRLATSIQLNATIPVGCLRLSIFYLLSKHDGTRVGQTWRIGILYDQSTDEDFKGRLISDYGINYTLGTRRAPTRKLQSASSDDAKREACKAVPVPFSHWCICGFFLFFAFRKKGRWSLALR